MLRGRNTFDPMWPHRCHLSSANCSPLPYGQHHKRKCNTRHVLHARKNALNSPGSHRCHSIRVCRLALPGGMAHPHVPYARSNPLRYVTYPCKPFRNARSVSGSTMFVCAANRATSLIQPCSGCSLRSQLYEKSSKSSFRLPMEAVLHSCSGHVASSEMISRPWCEQCSRRRRHRSIF